LGVLGLLSNKEICNRENSLVNVKAEVFARLWGIRDKDFSIFSINNIRKEFELTREDLDQLIFKRLKDIIVFAEQNCSYYSEIFNKAGISSDDLQSIEDIKHFPTLTRLHLKKNVRGLMSAKEINPSWLASATGGTTSSPVTFYCDKKAYAKKNLATLVIDEWYGRRLGDKVAYLWGSPQDFSSAPSLGQQLRNFTYQKRLMLPSSPLDKEILNSHCLKLTKWKPTSLQAYPTPLYELCQFANQENIDLSFVKNVSVTAETLNEHHRKVIEETLGLKIFNWYGSRELARVASECECHDGLHINEPSVLVEILEDPFLPKDCGYMVVTDLWNRATPLIRYETGDIARKIIGECACGRALKRIAAIEGRMVDLIVLPKGRKIPGVSLTNRIIKSSNEVSELQIVQKTKLCFMLRFVKGQDFRDSSLQSLKESLCTLLDENVEVLFEEVEEIPRERSGKVRFVISEVSEVED